MSTLHGTPYRMPLNITVYQQQTLENTEETVNLPPVLGRPPPSQDAEVDPDDPQLVYKFILSEAFDDLDQLDSLQITS